MPANMKKAGIKYVKGGAKSDYSIKTGKYKCGGPVNTIVNGKSLRPKR